MSKQTLPLFLIAIALVFWGCEEEALRPPAAPGNLIASGLSETRVKIIWQDRSDNERGFRAYEAIGDNNPFHPLDDEIFPNRGEWILEGKRANVDYIFKLTAYNDAGESDFSNQTRLTITDVVPEQPAGFSAELRNYTDVFLSWDDLSGVEDGYFVYQRVEPDSNWVPIDTLPANRDSLTVINLESVTTYRFALEAFNALGISSRVLSDTVTTLPEFLQLHISDGTDNPLPEATVGVNFYIHGEVVNLHGARFNRIKVNFALEGVAGDLTRWSHTDTTNERGFDTRVTFNSEDSGLATIRAWIDNYQYDAGVDTLYVSVVD